MISISLDLKGNTQLRFVLALSSSPLIEYYISRGSHVFVCFVDFCKAFDKVNYWTLFKQLIDDGVNRQLVALLTFWYTHQQTSVVWLNT